jgi:hypothetical protein
VNTGRASLRAGGAVARHPALWRTALVQWRRLVPDRWWVRRPFLPLPDAALLEFRSITQYGDPDHAPEPDDLVAWLGWCKAENRRCRIR